MPLTEGDVRRLEARLFPPDHDVFTPLRYRPNPGPQSEFHHIPAYAQGGPWDVLFGGAMGGGKALPLDTPIPTLGGWTTMGDIAVGDTVFDETGSPCTVTLATPVMVGHDCYRLTFDDGSQLVADADHEWLTFDRSERAALGRRTDEFRSARRAKRPSKTTGRRTPAFTAAVTARNRRLATPTKPPPTGTLHTTATLAATLDAGHAIRVAGALDLPDVELPIDPYVLGTWLGDGDSNGGAITTADHQTITELEQAGWPCRRVPSTPYGWRVEGLTTALRAAGLLHNKHIPAAYLRAGIKQRLALLQGLMDTDGHACASGAAEFTSTRRQLVDDVLELILTLGHRARITEGRATLDGRDCGPKFRIKWTPLDVVFRLDRKVARQQFPAERSAVRWRRLRAVESVPSVPVRCIAVSAPSHLYLAGRSMIPTHNTKALVMDSRGKVLATATAEHPIYAPRPLWSEQAPPDWWQSTVAATRAAIGKARVRRQGVAAIGLSGQMHGLVLTDAAGKCLRRAIIWNDQRTAREAADIEAAVGGRKRLIELTGNMAMTSFTLTKLLWVRRHERRIYDRVRHMLLPKDYIRLRLTGQFAGDVSDMSGTLMLDQRTRDWSAPIISKFQIDRSILPPVVESHEPTGRLSAVAADELGLAPGAIVVGGGGDQPVGAVGNGVVREGLTSATLGTSGVVFVHSARYITDPQAKVQTFCASVAGEYCLFGCILSAGGSLQWYRNTLAGPLVEQARKRGVDTYELLTRQAAKAPPGCEGLFFLPYLTGERTPHADPNARGCWIGLHSRTTAGELVRSVMEGATFAMNDAVTAFRERGVPIRQVRLSGGGARSQFWRQLQADIYGAACATTSSSEGPAYGAALLAAVGKGEFADIRQACDAAIRTTRTIKPTARSARLYAKLYQQYRRLYPALKGEFRRISEL